ncbi:bifunctional [glutamate--ammonia ligase]-adenylyl-L-tyrosine phosphorylase/[glutamate--ammonia-ligase] adenylyltransferase [Kushneria aurantia]|uniref:Bifunctional glutamine synthetase adenylyltransferase/adenylyl-removing enzyme n=1 Tax=Kushneria aurantia TaxID=504092 RepID=A0ABV6G7D1_9GAMM|nr:bifunctional [glutamate--ammonia ligase]-adenylyl-L-tyrosine phosphorylase/[glutamate--ammonia-ligase] adenylyltransferase [Kushneria aurantia]
MPLQAVLAALSDELATRVRHHFDALDDALLARLDDERLRELAVTLAASDFVAKSLSLDGAMLDRLLAHNELDAAPSREQLEKQLAAALKGCESEEQMQRALRRFRRERMVAIIWRDRNNHGDAWAIAAAVSRLAEVCLEAALSFHERALAQRYGHPAPDSEGRFQRLVVLGMGKLGAGELNLSSDIDLIFAWPEKGQTVGGERSLDHQEYFTRLGQKLIAALDAVTADGFVFRVDMRLRPLGDGGPLVNSFAATLSYYQSQGREWERYAMLKARPVAGDIEAGERLIDELRPFVYRKYIDFGAIESLREMKALINREVRRSGREEDIKLGAGGIREVEFVVQAFQLIRGGRVTELQTPSLYLALRHLEKLELIERHDARALMADYVFLRDLEHALQGLDDRQTQSLPQEDEARSRIAFAMGKEGWPALLEQLDEVRARVRQRFNEVVAAPEEADHELIEAGAMEEWRSLWQESFDDEAAVALLAESGFHDPSRARERLGRLRHGRAVTTMQRIGFERLDALMPALLSSVAATDSPDTTLERTLSLVESVLRRTAYLSLLKENPDALAHFVRLCAASAWISEQLARYPVLLDELLDPRSLYTPTSRNALEDELRQSLARLDPADEEAQLELLRLFRHARVLNVAAADILGARQLMVVSDHLTMIAEVVLEQVLRLAWRALVDRHGVPKRRDGTTIDRHDPDFLIVGYGKLGGIELGYGSDLDLVFLHDADPRGRTDGERELDTPVFFARLGQRIIHMLSATTPAGALYEVDMRLRPSGNAGLLVSSLEAFADYQRRDAWVWEHQALVRARPVAGSETLAARFNALRREILGRERDGGELRQAVVEMRDRMRRHLGSSRQQLDAGEFHLKHDPGGMIDIEFMNQYAVLAMSHRAPALLDFTDNMRLLETLEAAGQLPLEGAEQLREAWLAYRDESHRTALARSGSRVSAERFATHRERVQALWSQWMGEPDST